MVTFQIQLAWGLSYTLMNIYMITEWHAFFVAFALACWDFPYTLINIYMITEKIE